jgi:hypothetical protein
MRRFPLSFLALTFFGVLCGVPGLVSMAGFGGLIHPLLADEGAGLAFVVSAVALIGSGMFPLVIARLRASEALPATDRRD